MKIPEIIMALKLKNKRKALNNNHEQLKTTSPIMQSLIEIVGASTSVI